MIKPVPPLMWQVVSVATLAKGVVSGAIKVGKIILEIAEHSAQKLAIAANRLKSELAFSPKESPGVGGPSTAVADAGAASKVKWADENTSMSSTAQSYNDSATGARSNPATQSCQAPALERTMPDGTVRTVKFDGLDGDVLIDRKV